MKITTTLFLACAIFLGINVYSQTEVSPSDGYLNEIILDDASEDGYILERDATYYVTGAFECNFKLKLVAADGDGALPIIRAYPATSGMEWAMITLNDDCEFENIMISAAMEEGSSQADDWIVVSNGANVNLKFNNCIFINSQQGGIMATNAVDSIVITNCKFYNTSDISTDDPGNGRMVDFRSSDIAHAIIEHNTVVNSIDRIVRHRGGVGSLDEFKFNHNTIVNNGSYHGMFELNNTGTSIEMTDNLIVDGMSFGSDSTDATRLAELDDNTETYANGNPKMVWVGSVPNDSTVFTIKNNIYVISDALQTFYTTESVDEGDIFTDNIEGLLSNVDSAFMSKDISLVDIPDAMTDLATWYYDNGKTKEVSSSTDFDRMSIDYMLNTLDCSFDATSDLLGTDGIAVGDSNWFTEDGTSAISQVSVQEMDLATYPNPFDEYTTVHFNLDQGAAVSVMLTDITGKVIEQYNAGNYSAGAHSITIEKGDLTSGLYILTIEAGTEVGKQKLVVQ